MGQRAVAVVLTGVGKRYDIVSAFAQHAFTVAVDPNPLAPARYAADVALAPPRIDDPGYVPFLREVVDRTVAIVGDAPTFLTVDVDVLDPAFAPGTGTPEPGGMTSVDLLWACRALARRLRLVGMDVVEVIPTGVGSADVTALVAERIVREALTGLAARRLA